MQISDTQLQKFMDLYQNRFGETITKKEALRKGLKLLRLIKTLYAPMTPEEFERLKNRRAELATQKKQQPREVVREVLSADTDSLGVHA